MGDNATIRKVKVEAKSSEKGEETTVEVWGKQD
jgi:hypothetical protein